MIIVTATILSACGTQTTDRAVLLAVEDDPTISFRLCFYVGSQCDPEGKEGLAALTATMMSGGATTVRSYEEILEELYPMAASYGFSVDKEMSVLTGRVHIDNLEEYYPLLLDAVLRPGFTDADFNRLKTNMINGIEKSLRYSDDEELAKAALYNFIYEGTPYGYLNAGRLSSLNNITLDDVRDFHRTWFTRDNVVVGLGGSYEPSLLKRLMEDLHTLPESATEPPSPPTPVDINGLELLVVEKQCDATAISFGFPIQVLRGDEDFWALALFNSWFGEHRNSSSHLYQIIREARGMNYGDYSYIEIFPNGGRRQMPAPNNARRQQLFEVWIRPVQHEHRHFVLRAAMRELKNIVDNGMTEEQFNLTKKFLHKYVLQYATTTSDRLGYAIDSKFYGIRGDYIELLRSRISKLTLEQVNDAIRRHIQYENMKIAMVTQDAESLIEAFVTNAPSPVTYSTPIPSEILAEDEEIAVFPLPFYRENIRVVAVDDMFE